MTLELNYIMYYFIFYTELRNMSDMFLTNIVTYRKILLDEFFITPGVLLICTSEYLDFFLEKNISIFSANISS